MEIRENLEYIILSVFIKNQGNLIPVWLILCVTINSLVGFFSLRFIQANQGTQRKKSKSVKFILRIFS